MMVDVAGLVLLWAIGQAHSTGLLLFIIRFRERSVGKGVQMILENKQSLSFAKRYYHRFREDQCPRMAASLAYSTLLTMVPLLIIVISILSWFPIFHGVGHDIERLVLDTFVPN